MKNQSNRRQLVELIKRKTIGSSDHYGKEQALEWCKKNAISSSEAISKILMSNQRNEVDFYKACEKEYRYGNRGGILAQRC